MCAPCICSNCHLDACFLAYINDFIIIIAIRICKPDIIYPKLILQSLIAPTISRSFSALVLRLCSFG